MNCLELTQMFLERISIKQESYESAYKKLVQNQLNDQANIPNDYGYQMICYILTDTYCLNADNVKKIADIISKKYKALGRYEKDLIKHYLDYNDKASINELYTILSSFVPTDQLESIINEYRFNYNDEVINKFIKNWNKAETVKDENKKLDYLEGIYTRLVSKLNDRMLSLNDIYLYNQEFLNEELDNVARAKLLEFCKDNTKIDVLEARKKFYDFYLKLLDEDLLLKSNNNKLEEVMNKSFAINTPFYECNTEGYAQVICHITQEMYDQSSNFNVFMDLVLSSIQQSYRVLKNHKMLAIIIENVFDHEGHNLKWQLYSYIGIYAEHFIPTKEKRKFYKPEQLAMDKISYLGFEVRSEDESLFNNYFSNKFDRDAFVKRFPGVNIEDVFLDFEHVWYGYTFSDCLSVVDGEFRQYSEINFINNKNELVLLFNKYRHDDRKIPCPVCAGLDISGNSFPEVGLRSWECKNIICPSRSKSNRGKRYSYKSNFMQRGFEDSFDIISKDLIRKWRRDIIKVDSKNDIYQMLIEYFSFTGDNILVINGKIENLSKGRVITQIKYLTDQIQENTNGLFEKYFNGTYIKRFIDQVQYNDNSIDEELNSLICKSEKSVLINADSRSILSKIKECTFDAAVTSPPYYNARLYSQWPNLYLYLSDMYEIIKQTFRTLKPGAVYLYNIGDICGNENTVVRSTMGKKRILLGSYTIFLFLKAGFELMDNILWDKGEPQSNRQNNDGKFTPYYQRPMNVYEHMFLFKKPGANCFISEENISKLDENWKTNIVAFTPVIKINSKGENTLGHTAPFPLDIPDYISKVFTTNEHDLILEPFAGSGTSIVSASNHGRRCLGIELSKEYSELIVSICKINEVNIKKLGE